VLIVDDSPGAVEFLTSVLREVGYRVVQCPDASRVSEAMAEAEPDLIIVDALLPAVSGYEVCRRIREAGDAPLPVVITTSAYDEADELEALDAGANDVLIKPIRPHELLARVQSLLHLKDLYHRVEQHAQELAEINERLRELDQMKDSLTHMIVHDLRTPLTSIITGLQTLEQVDYEEDLSRELVPMAIEGAAHLAEMITNLLDISKMESGQMALHREPVLLEEVAAEAVGRVANLAEQNDLHLVTEVAQGLEVYADRDLLGRVLVNLLGNAIKFTPSGGTITVGAEREDREVVVSVRDTGEGIPEHELDRIFDKFHMVEGTRAPQRRGTGLGLSFVKLAVEAHGGRVWVESKLGEGSAFYFTLPVPAE